MVACDNPECSVEWFHFECVGLSAAVRALSSRIGDASHFFVNFVAGEVVLRRLSCVDGEQMRQELIRSLCLSFEGFKMKCFGVKSQV